MKKLLQIASITVATSVMSAVALADVSVSENGGDLEISGSSGQDAIQITAVGNGYRIKGLTVNGMTTLVNGQNSVTVGGIDEDFEIDLREGNDRLVVRELTVPDELQVETGDGDDFVKLVDVRVNADSAIDGERGNDTLRIINSELYGDNNLEMGDGNDKVVLNGSYFGDETEVDLQDGNDRLTVKNSLFADELQADGGSGTDRFRNSGGNQFEDGADIEDFE